MSRDFRWSSSVGGAPRLHPAARGRVTDLVLKSLLESQLASSTASKWECRPPTSRLARRKLRPVLSSAGPAGLAGGGAFFLANREVRKIKNAAFCQLRCCSFRWQSPIRQRASPHGLYKRSPLEQKASFKNFAWNFRSTGKKVLRGDDSLPEPPVRPVHVLNCTQHTLYGSSSSSAEVAVFVGGYSQMTSQLRSSPWRWRQQDARPSSGTSPHGPHRPLLPAASDSLWVAGYTCSSSYPPLASPRARLCPLPACLLLACLPASISLPLVRVLQPAGSSTRNNGDDRWCLWAALCRHHAGTPEGPLLLLLGESQHTSSALSECQGRVFFRKASRPLKKVLAGASNPPHHPEPSNHLPQNPAGPWGSTRAA